MRRGPSWLPLRRRLKAAPATSSCRAPQRGSLDSTRSQRRQGPAEDSVETCYWPSLSSSFLPLFFLFSSSFLPLFFSFSLSLFSPMGPSLSSVSIDHFFFFFFFFFFLIIFFLFCFCFFSFLLFLFSYHRLMKMIFFFSSSSSSFKFIPFQLIVTLIRRQPSSPPHPHPPSIPPTP